MRTSSAQIVQKNKVVGVIGLVAEIRKRLDDGHYNFMTWNGRNRLVAKLSECERYANEPHKSRSAAVTSEQKQKLKDMETELRALLGSTY